MDAHSCTCIYFYSPPLGAFKPQLGGHIVYRCCLLLSTPPVIICIFYIILLLYKNIYLYIYIYVYEYVHVHVHGYVYYIYIDTFSSCQFVLLGFCMSDALRFLTSRGLGLGGGGKPWKTKTGFQRRGCSCLMLSTYARKKESVPHSPSGRGRGRGTEREVRKTICKKGSSTNM